MCRQVEQVQERQSKSSILSGNKQFTCCLKVCEASVHTSLHGRASSSSQTNQKSIRACLSTFGNGKTPSKGNCSGLWETKTSLDEQRRKFIHLLRVENEMTKKPPKLPFFLPCIRAEQKKLLRELFPCFQNCISKHRHQEQKAPFQKEKATSVRRRTLGVSKSSCFRY